MTRTEFMEMLAYNFSEDDCRRLFAAERDDLEDGSAEWNCALDYEYNVYMAESGEEGE